MQSRWFYNPRCRGLYWLCSIHCKNCSKTMITMHRQNWQMNWKKIFRLVEKLSEAMCNAGVHLPKLLTPIYKQMGCKTYLGGDEVYTGLLHPVVFYLFKASCRFFDKAWSAAGRNEDAHVDIVQVLTVRWRKWETSLLLDSLAAL